MQPSTDGLEQIGDLMAALSRLFCRTLGIAGIGPDENFFDLGGDSMLAIVLASQIETSFGKRISIADLYDAPSVRSLAEALVQEQGAAVGVLRLMKPGEYHQKLFLVTGAGGSALELHLLAQHIECRGPIYAFRSFGLDGQTAPLQSIDEMADAYVAELRMAQPVGPYAMAGYSMGGLVALEMARRLVEAGEKVAPLILIDSILPYESWPLAARLGAWNELIPLYLRSTSWRAALRFHLFCIRRLIGPILPPTWQEPARNAATINDIETQRDAIHAIEANSLGAPRASLANVIARVLVTNMAACRAYRPRPYDGDAYLLQSASSNQHLINAWLWRRLVRNLDVQEIPGDHVSIVREDVASLADTISGLLHRALTAAIRQP